VLQVENQISDAGAAGLGEGLKVNSSLQWLYLVSFFLFCVGSMQVEVGEVEQQSPKRRRLRSTKSPNEINLTLANELLAKVFTFKIDGTVSFRPEILGREGVTKLQELCVLTRNMLLAYYMQVESLFIRGIMVYEQI
jgi:hypothetical protein